MGIPIHIINNYLSTVSSYREIILGDAETRFLTEFMNGSKSAYAIYAGYKMNYKNVHKRVRRLYELNLIEEQGSYYPYIARYYKLTTRGLFYIFSNFMLFPLELIRENKDNIIFKTLLYTYFDVQTILHPTIRLFVAIKEYLGECCRTTLNTFKTIELITDEYKKNDLRKQLEFDLEWSAKTMAFKLISKNDDLYQYYHPFEFEFEYYNEESLHLYHKIKTSKLLSKDKRFMKLVQAVAKETEVGYKQLMDQG